MIAIGIVDDSGTSPTSRKYKQSLLFFSAQSVTVNMLPPGSPGIFSAAGNALCQSAQGGFQSFQSPRLQWTTLQQIKHGNGHFPVYLVWFSHIFPWKKHPYGGFPSHIQPRGYAWCTLIESWSFTRTSRYVASISTGAAWWATQLDAQHVYTGHILVMSVIMSILNSHVN